MDGLIKTSEAPIFTHPQTTPAEAGIRRLKAIMDALLLEAMHESLDNGEDPLSGRVTRARTALETLTCAITPNLWHRAAAYAIYEGHYEQATSITDRLLMQGPCSMELHLTATLAQLYDRRFQEARDALMSAQQCDNKDRHLTQHINRLRGALDSIVTEQAAQTPYTIPPKRTYVLADQHNGLIDFQLGETLRSLLPGEDVILVQDRIDAYDVKSQYGERILSIETEHRLWERHEGEHKNLRVILKNNNNGHPIKALKMGVRKALGAGSQEVLTRTDNHHWSGVIAGLVKEADTRTKTKASTHALTRLNAHIPKKRIALFGVSKEDYGHGVPIVMLNIVRTLSNSAFTFSYIANDFDTNRITYFDETSQVLDFENRAAFINFIHRVGIQFDILHFHSWHYADHYKPFRCEHDPLGIEILIKQLNPSKVIYTDHANPTEDLRRIHEHHAIDYAALDDASKETFLRDNNLNRFNVQDWRLGWEAASILCRRQIMQLADHIVHVSATQRQEEDQFILPHYTVNGKHAVIWNGTDLLDYQNLPEIQTKSQKLKKDKRNNQQVLYVGRAEKEKGIFDLAAAAARLRKVGAPINLTFVGQFSSDLRRQLDQTATQKNQYTGLIKDRAELAAHYASTDLIAQPTWGECFNQVISEGLAVGTASVVSDISGPKEVYVSNGIAIGHQPQNPHSLAAAIQQALTNNPLRQSVIDKGRQFVAQHLSAKTMAAQYSNLYKA